MVFGNVSIVIVAFAMCGEKAQVVGAHFSHQVLWQANELICSKNIVRYRDGQLRSVCISVLT